MLSCFNLVNAAPDHRRCPVPTREWPVVFHRSCLAPLATRFQRFRMLEPSDTVLCRPVARWSDTRPPGPRVQCRQLNTPSLLIRLSPVKRGSLQLHAINDESRSYYSKTGMRGILQMMTERSHRQLRCRRAMDISDWS